MFIHFLRAQGNAFSSEICKHDVFMMITGTELEILILNRRQLTLFLNRDMIEC